MKLIKQSWKSWLAYDEGRGIESLLRKKIVSAEIWLSDLDGTDAKSPAKRIARRATGTSHFSPRYIHWAMHSGFRWIKGNKREEEIKAWNSYMRLFLEKREALEDVRRLFTQEVVKMSLYPNVAEFYSMLKAEKYYVTRNMGLVALLYTRTLGFEGYFAEVEDKGKVIENFILARQPASYGCSGNSEDDLPMADVLRYYEKKRRIKSAVSIFCEKKPCSGVSGFDFYTSRDRKCLVDFLREGTASQAECVR